MPAISSGKVLVTGANGFIAVWTVKALLEAGFSVRGAVRSPSKAEHLKTIFSSYGDKLEFAFVPDMVQDGAFDEAAVGVDAIVHTASPVHLTADDPADIIDPAVNGTLGVLRAATANAPSVKRVVFVSTCGTVLTRNAPGPRLYDETCWNEADVSTVQTLGRAAPPLLKYSASKILAERAAWAFYEEHKGSQQWDLVVVNPPWVLGPVLHEVVGSGPESLNNSNRLLFEAITKRSFTVPANCYIDVRDLAQALLLAVTKPSASGERIIASASPFRWEDFILAASTLSSKIQPLETPYDAAAEVYKVVYDNSKSKEVLGVTYRSIEETTADMLNDWETRGLL
ncbi:NAD-P-binding protein [Trametes versicolor FP-101664 SS1]|uniref:NAD-P-binding protein n=1 Tax=Trametes versicolor (strain FP-101664) TaxID=717944 RepID=UPI000462225E|nr:NAD-P-binding protein [Trametes versicolor FP-101664 SS1]EIW55909.1 NAD-P-binding protein [Trametes versicolor FP-101664 SS1]